LGIATKEIEARAADLSATRQELDKNKERLSEAEKRIAEMEPLEDERYAQQKQDLALRAMIANLREESLVAQNNCEQLTAKLEEKEAESRELQQERSSWRERQAEFEERTLELTARIREQNNERQALLVELEGLTPRLAELDQCRERLGVLESSLAEMDALKKTIGHLRNENSRLRSLELVHGVSPHLQLTPSPGRLAQSLNKLIEDLNTREGARGAVVADENGFLAAGAGDHMEALAAIAALYDQIAEKVPDMLPVGKLARVDIVDENDLTIAVQPLPVDTDRLLLVSLSVGPGPEREAVDQLFRHSLSAVGAALF
jgi:DNA repair exonuclease SbcCD ATPase subunit